MSLRTHQFRLFQILDKNLICRWEGGLLRKTRTLWTILASLNVLNYL